MLGHSDIIIKIVVVIISNVILHGYLHFYSYIFLTLERLKMASVVVFYQKTMFTDFEDFKKQSFFSDCALE